MVTTVACSASVVKDALGLLNVVEIDADGKACLFVEAARRRVRGHENGVADGQTGMEDFLLPFGRHLAGRWRAVVREHRLDFSVEKFFVKLEGFFAVTVEIEIRIELHGALLY